jgi:hypothetical protein
MALAVLREIARRAGGGRFVYRAWHAPRAAIRRLRREGSVNLALARLGRRAMQREAPSLAPLPMPAEDAHEVFYLTGHRFAYQTAFCAVSLGRQAGPSIRIACVDDGTLTDLDVAMLRRVIPQIRIVSEKEIEPALDSLLPASRFPELRRRRLVYPHLRKLTDVHAIGAGWKLVLDSDMLFHNKPDFLIHWLNAPDRPCHMIDVADAYGYSPRLLRELAGCKLPQRVNVGVCGLNSGAIDWEKLEYWCRQMIVCEGTHYLMEQALVAMLIAGKQCAVAPAGSYMLAPNREEVEHPTAILHHYVFESKAWYFRFAWRHIVANQEV